MDINERNTRIVGFFSIIWISLFLIMISSCKNDCTIIDEVPVDPIAGKIKSMVLVRDTSIAVLFYYDSSGRLVMVRDTDTPGLEFNISYPSDTVVFIGWINELDFEVHLQGNMIKRIIGVSSETMDGRPFDWEVKYGVDTVVDSVQMPFDITISSFPSEERVCCGTLSELEFNGNYTSSKYSFLDVSQGATDQRTFEYSFSYSTLDYQYDIPGQVPYNLYSDDEGDILNTFGLQTLSSNFIWILRIAGYHIFNPNQNLLSQVNNVRYEYTLDSTGHVNTMVTMTPNREWTVAFTYY